MNQLSTKSD